MKLVNITDLKSVGHYDLAGSSPAPRIYIKSRSDPMKYKLEDRYVWIEDGTQIVKMYFINEFHSPLTNCLLEQYMIKNW